MFFSYELLNNKVILAEMSIEVKSSAMKITFYRTGRTNVINAISIYVLVQACFCQNTNIKLFYRPS